MPICTVGQIVPVSIDVEILKMFAYEDRVFYIAKPLRGKSESIWLLSIDGSVVDFNEDLFKKAYAVLDR